MLYSSKVGTLKVFVYELEQYFYTFQKPNVWCRFETDDFYQAEETCQRTDNLSFDKYDNLSNDKWKLSES